MLLARSGFLGDLELSCPEGGAGLSSDPTFPLRGAILLLTTHQESVCKPRFVFIQNLKL
jgi:hypothetical protein